MSIHILNKTRDGIDIHGIRQVTRQAHNNGDISVVAFTSQRERAVHVNHHAVTSLSRLRAIKSSVNCLPAFIGLNGMRTGRANADFENIEYANHRKYIALKRRKRRPKAARKDLAEQRVEDCGDCNQTHHDNEYVAHVTAVLTHCRYFLNLRTSASRNRIIAMIGPPRVSIIPRSTRVQGGNNPGRYQHEQRSRYGSAC